MKKQIMTIAIVLGLSMTSFAQGGLFHRGANADGTPAAVSGGYSGMNYNYDDSGRVSVIRRLDAMLEETKPAVLAMKKQLDAAKIDNQWPALCNAAGQAFCNASPFLLKDLTSRSKAQT